jgi:serine/threonine-protein kinase RsbW
VVVASPVPELELEFPPRPEFVRTARHTASALARLHELSDQTVEDLKLAVSEACTNAVTENAKQQSAEPVLLRIRRDGASLLLEVLDRGPGLDPALIDRDAELDSQEFSFEKGLSLPLIRGLVEDLSLTPRDGGGTVVSMRVAADPGPNGLG